VVVAAKERILVNDVQEYVQQSLQASGGTGIKVSAAAEIDFTQFGVIEKQSFEQNSKNIWHFFTSVIG
jgi:hypothetical protein